MNQLDYCVNYEASIVDISLEDRERMIHNVGREHPGGRVEE